MAWTEIAAASKNRIEKGLMITLSEEAPNDISKDLTLADVTIEGDELELMAIRIEFIATATVGTRTITVELLDAADADVIWQFIVVSNTVTAGVTKVWQFGRDVDEAVTSPQDVILPTGMTLHAGMLLRIADSAAIDAAADDMQIHVVGRVR